MPHVHLNREIDLDEIIRRFARLHLRDLRRMEMANIQTPRKGDLGPELKRIKIPWGERILSNNCFPPPPPPPPHTHTHTVSNKKNIAQSQGGTAIYELYSRGGRSLQGNLWYSPPASMTSRLSSVTFKMASKVFIEEKDKNFDFITEIPIRFLGFGDFKVSIIIGN